MQPGFQKDGTIIRCAPCAFPREFGPGDSVSVQLSWDEREWDSDKREPFRVPPGRYGWSAALPIYPSTDETARSHCGGQVPPPEGLTQPFLSFEFDVK